MNEARPFPIEVGLHDAPPAAPTTPPILQAIRRIGISALQTLLYATGSVGLMLAVWMGVCYAVGNDLPTPLATMQVLWKLVSNPFYDNGPNDKGIGIQIVASLGRVFVGFSIGALIAIPLGILMGASTPCRRLFNPIVQILRPVSPLAWYPIGLATLKAAPTACTFAIVITALWPTLINTAFGVASLPEDYRTVARVFQFSRSRYLMKILLPYAFPHILTGLRLSMGIAWMVIVAAEMLAGGTGIGFFVWDSWNSLSLENVISAIILIGGVGLILDRGFEWLLRRFSFTV